MNTRRKPLYQAILLGATLSCSSLALAIEPAEFKLGAIDLIPTMKIDAGEDGNILRADTDEIESIVTVIAPRLQAILETGANIFSLDLEAFEGDFQETSEDDYSDFRASASAHLELNSRNIVDLSLSEFATHEPRGTGFSEGTDIPIANEFDDSRWDASYQFGNKETFGRLVFNIGEKEVDYTNNLVVNQFRSREDEKSGAALYFNLSPRTALLAEYRHRDIDYAVDVPPQDDFLDSLDSEEDYFFVGIEWEATAAIAGSVRIGTGEKEFDDKDRVALDEPSYELGLTWQPLSYTTFSLDASRLFDEASGAGNAIERELISLNWQHDWSDRLSTIVNVSTTDEAYGGTLRTDETDYYSIGMKYAFARWLDFHMEYFHDDKDSSEFALSYDRPVFNMGIEISL